MKNYKVIITGPVGAGKTTAIQTISDNLPIQTDAKVTDITRKRKEHTTVAMDFGLTQLDADTRVHIYGTPGQQRFHFMWGILQKNADGIILLLDNSRKYPFKDLRLYVESFKETIQNKALIIGVSQINSQRPLDLNTYRNWVEQLGVQAKVFHVDVRKRAHVLRLINEIIHPSSDQTFDLLQNFVSKPLPPPVQPTGLDNLLPTKPLCDATRTEQPSIITENKVMKNNILDEIMQIQHIKGVTLTNTMGEQVASNIEDEQLNEFIGFIAGMMPSFEETAALGSIQSVVLRSTQDDNIAVFIEEEQALGILFHKKMSLQNLRQQINDSMQWGA